ARALGVTDAEREALLGAATTARAARDAASARSRRHTQSPASPRPLPPLGGSARLPAPLTSFVGRQAALAYLTVLLQPPRDCIRGEQDAGSCRLLTLTGPGGVGKSRLALAVATRLAPTFCDGARLVELAALSASGAEVSPFEQAVGAALGLPTSPSRLSLAALVDAL